MSANKRSTDKRDRNERKSKPQLSHLILYIHFILLLPVDVLSLEILFPITVDGKTEKLNFVGNDTSILDEDVVCPSWSSVTVSDKLLWRSCRQQVAVG